MKQKKTLIIMLCVLAGLITITLLINTISKVEDKISKTAAVVVDEKAEEITGIKMSISTLSLEFVKTDDQWYYGLDKLFPVDQESVEELLNKVNKVSASFKISDVTNYGQYGLKNPIATIEITNNESNVMTINLGDYSTMDSQRYIENGDGNVYLIEDDLYDVISVNKDDFLKKDEFADYNSILSFILSAKQNLEIIYDDTEEYGYSTKYDYFLNKEGNYQALSSTKVNSLISSIKNLSLDDYASYYCASENLSYYNLETPECTIVLNLSNGLNIGSQTLYISRKNGNAYLKFDTSDIVYNIDSDTAGKLIELTYDDIRATEVCWVDYKQVDLITFMLDGEEYELIGNKGKFSFNGESIEIDTLQNAIDDLIIDEFNANNSDKKVEISFIIQQQNETVPLIGVRLIQLNSEYCIAVFNNEVLGKVKRDSVVTLKEALNAIILGD